MKIIFKDKDFIAVDKPAGMAVHGGVGIGEKTLVDFLIRDFPEIKNVGDDPQSRPGIVHRLDKDTSGIMIVAKRQEFFDYLKGLFKNREIDKEYLAIIHGKPKQEKGIIEGEIGRSKRDFRKQSLARGKISVRKERYSLSHYEVLKKCGKFSLLRVVPKTGRMHQIRVHLHSIGHPIVGDRKYTFKKYKKQKYSRMFLHASRISFICPDGKKVELGSDLPKEFEVCLDFLGE